MAENEDRTEKATARRREKAREKGQGARSRELVALSTAAGVFFVFYLAGNAFMQRITGLTARLLGLGYGRDTMAVMRSAGVEMMLILAPFFVAAVSFAVLSNVLQGGILFKPLEIDPERLSPLAGIKKLFSLSAVPGMIKNVLKFIVGIIVFYIIMRKVIVVLPMTSAMDLTDIQAVAFGLSSQAIIYTLSTFFVLALIDYLYERWKFERSIRMSKEEIREESKESEGDPLIKAKIKGMQREAARRRMMAAVPKATVVITNPTHIAVALLYKKNETTAPKVVAKGKGYIAEKIRELARTNGVPLVEDKPLARALFKIDLDAVIPSDLFRAVAKILAYIFKLRGAAS